MLADSLILAGLAGICGAAFGVSMQLGWLVAGAAALVGGCALAAKARRP